MPYDADTPYATTAELEGHMASTSVDSDVLELALKAASREIDRWCGRKFDQEAAGTRYLTPTAPDFLFTPDVVSLSEVAVRPRYDDATWTVLSEDRYELQRTDRYDDPDSPYTLLRALGRSFPAPQWGHRTMRLRGVFGWPSVPDDIKLATIIQAGRLAGRGAIPYGAQEIGAVSVFVRLDDPDVLRLTSGYRRRRIG